MRYDYLFFYEEEGIEKCCLACGEERPPTKISKVTIINGDESKALERKEFILPICKTCFKVGGTLPYRAFRRILNLRENPRKCFY